MSTARTGWSASAAAGDPRTTERPGQPVWKLWGLDCKAGPPTDYTIGIDTIEVMVAKLREAASAAGTEVRILGPAPDSGS